MESNQTFVFIMITSQYKTFNVNFVNKKENKDYN